MLKRIHNAAIVLNTHGLSTSTAGLSIYIVKDMAPLIMIMTPILLPVVMDPRIGMDPIHFGVMLIFNLAVGLCTPPVGSALFVGCAVGKTSLEKTSKAALPMFAVMFVVLMLVTFIPEITMWLPGILFGR